MIRIFNVYFPSRVIFLAASEALMITLALFSATFLLAGGDFGVRFLHPRDLVGITLATAVVIVCMHYYDLYDSLSLKKQAEVFARMIQVAGSTAIILACLYYAYPPILPARESFFIWIVSTAVISLVWRRVFLAANRSSQLLKRAVLLGSGPISTPLIAELDARPEFGMSIVGYLETPADCCTPTNGLPCLGRAEALPKVIRSEHVASVILATPESRRWVAPSSGDFSVQDGASLYEAITGRVCLASLNPDASIRTGGQAVSRFVLVSKRIASVVLSSAALLVASPFMLITAVLIRIDSRGPAIFRQRRVGKGGKVFTMYKFRSMWLDADAGGAAMPAARSDSRITRVGKWIRRIRVDESPQLFNILRGDMDLVGPRPFTVYEEANLERLIPAYGQRWAVKPGATGWAQVNRGYCDSLEDNKEKLSYDLFYIKNMSLGLDCLIILQSFKILLLGRGGR